MKRVFICFILAMLTTSLAAQEKVGPKMTFDSATHNFGDVERKGGDLVKEFRFVNDGDEPLVIKKITKSCSCTTVNYSRKPVMPGQSGVISIKYEPHKVEEGVFNRVIQIYTNASNKARILAIQGNSIENGNRKKK